MRKPWSDEELAALAAIEPGRHGGVGRHAEQYGRSRTAVSSKLDTLRRRRLARDCGVRPEQAVLHGKYRL